MKKLALPTSAWGPRLQVHRAEAHVPKHTDSQVPLTLPSYDPDGMDDNDSDSRDSRCSDGNASRDGLQMAISVQETGV